MCKKLEAFLKARMRFASADRHLDDLAEELIALGRDLKEKRISIATEMLDETPGVPDDRSLQAITAEWLLARESVKDAWRRLPQKSKAAFHGQMVGAVVVH